MRYIKKLILFIFLLFPSITFSQIGEEVEMADVLRRDGKIYTVVAGLVIILTAMIILLIRLDRKVMRIEENHKTGRSGD